MTIFDPQVDMAYLDGKLITQEMLDDLANRAERTGPPANPIHIPDPRRVVVLPEQLFAVVSARATAEDMDITTWVNKLVEKELALLRG